MTGAQHSGSGGGAERRSSYRTDVRLPAILHMRGQELSVTIVDLSAGGVRFESPGAIEFTAHDQLVLEISLDDGLSIEVGVPRVEIDLQVLASHVAGETPQLRCRNLYADGTPEYERVRKLVFALDRRKRAQQSGVDKASRYARDPNERQRPTRSIEPGSISIRFD